MGLAIEEEAVVLPKSIWVLLVAVCLAGCGSQDVVTKAKYNAVQTDMGYRQVAKIIGSGGEELSRSMTPGIPGIMHSVEHVAVVWQNSDGSNMTAMFENGYLVTKAQVGLR